MHPALVNTRLVICDLDGTLVNSLPDLSAALDSAFLDAGLPMPGHDKAKRWVGNGMRMLVTRALLDANVIAPDDHSDETRALVDRHFELFNQAYQERLCVASRLYPGVEEFLVGIKDRGMTLALITNKTGVFVPPILNALGISDCFSRVLGGDALPTKKPDPAPLAHVAEGLGLTPRETLMVGDSRNDVLAGKAFGARTLAVSYGYNHGEPISACQPDWIVDNLAAVLDD